MKTLKEYIKEGLLSDVEDQVVDMDNKIDDFMTFGKRFKLKRCVNVSDTTAKIIHINSVKKLSKDLDYINDTIERGQFDRKGTLKMLANIIDHIRFDEIGMPMNAINDANTEKFRIEFGLCLEKFLRKNDVFNNPASTMCICPSIKATGTDEFHIMIDKSGYDMNAFKFVYEIIK